MTKTYLLTILYNCNHLYKIYYAFKKKSGYIIVVKKEKDIISDNAKIHAYNKVSISNIKGKY